MEGKEKILYVDDETINLELFKINFRNEYDVVVANSAIKGLEILKGEPIKVVVSDLKMPVMNGLEFLRRIGVERIHADIPVIIVTTEDKEGETLRALQNGARGYVKKPFHPTSLHTLIEQIFKVTP